MAFKADRAQTNLLTTATNVFDVFNTSGVSLGNILLTNVHPSATIQSFVSVVPTGSTMTSGNAVLWNIPIGPSGVLSISLPINLISGDKLQGSGSAIGLNILSSFNRLN